MAGTSICLLLICSVQCVLWHTTDCVEPGSNDDANAAVPQVPQMETMLIHSVINSNYAKVYVTNEMKNDAKYSKDTSFTVHLPVSAFISNFTMKLGTKILTGVVKSKEKAEKDYKNALEQGETAGHVQQQPPNPDRDMQIFSVSVNIAPKSSTVFVLVYEELIEKKFGLFTQRLHIEPGQVVPNVTLLVNLYDNQGILSFGYQYPGQNTFISSSSPSVQLQAGHDRRIVLYEPSSQEQVQFNTDTGINGDFLIQYNLNRGDTGGTIYYDNRNFVHFFSPNRLEVMDKNIAFIIDISGSMGGLKIERTREAMLFILDELRTNDYFNILLFDDRIYTWSETPMLASTSNIERAKSHVREKVKAQGSTNIQDALLTGLSNLDAVSQYVSRGSTIVFLTDGNPTSGETNPTTIRNNIKRNNENGITIFSLGFGDDVDFEFLQTLSLQNHGRAKKIYVDSDAADQLRDFYEEIDSPLLTDIYLIYDSNTFIDSSLTTTSYSQYFRGTEIVSVGQIQMEHISKDEVYVRAQSKSQKVTLRLDNLIKLEESDFLDRLFAYWKIKDLLQKEKITDDSKEKARLKNEILNMSLSYNFVTPVTSMIVTESVNKENQRRSLHMEDMKVRKSNQVVFAQSAFGGGVHAISDIVLLFLILTVAPILTYLI